ncbi:shikimate dehydrogenase [Paraperlucidibaca baekdonensis]|uniref:Shikimate dehydrogenase (NADP(+)) n=1 Tax=Paraperlucidibaca baekdonensis TaxID=748120 RepID=A0A3E0HA72_9GAMM|nr:shikimate dehydrogenase [Paraperlucidibaca baekdonensis]REH40092.1 shikimate dehydrogenase [Paraperlucidibaca baekdonensis]
MSESVIAEKPFDQYAVIGHPIEHSQSPRIHAAFAKASSQRMVYEALLSPLDGLAQTWATLRANGGRGANITVPFKVEAMALCDQLSDRAELAGAVNTLSVLADGQVRGDNTDGAGLVRDIETNAGWQLAGQRVLLLGAGGASAGVLGPLLAAGVAHICIANRTLAKADKLAAAFAGMGSVSTAASSALAQSNDSASYDLIINATSASLQGKSIDIGASWYRESSAVYDMMYGFDTAFLAWARGQQISRRRDGLGMLVEQAAEAFYVWRGVRPDTQALLSSLRAELD